MRGLRILLCLSVFGCATTDDGDATTVPLRVGIAKVKITPAEPVMLAGYGSRNKVSEGVAADLYARALAIDDGTSKTVIVTADIIAFGPVSQPMRQPVMPWLFDIELMTSVRSAMPGRERGEMCSPPPSVQ